MICRDGRGLKANRDLLWRDSIKKNALSITFQHPREKVNVIYSRHDFVRVMSWEVEVEGMQPSAKDDRRLAHGPPQATYSIDSKECDPSNKLEDVEENISSHATLPEGEGLLEDCLSAMVSGHEVSV